MAGKDFAKEYALDKIQALMQVNEEVRKHMFFCNFFFCWIRGHKKVSMKQTREKRYSVKCQEKKGTVSNVKNRSRFGHQACNVKT